MSDSVWPHRRQPTRLPRPWDSPGRNTGVGCHFLLQCMQVKSDSEVAQSCPTLSDPMDWSLPGSSVHGIFQAGVLLQLEWIAIPFSRGFSWSRDWTWVLCITGRFFTTEPPRKPVYIYIYILHAFHIYMFHIYIFHIYIYIYIYIYIHFLFVSYTSINRGKLKILGSSSHLKSWILKYLTKAQIQG